MACTIQQHQRRKHYLLPPEEIRKAPVEDLEHCVCDQRAGARPCYAVLRFQVSRNRRQEDPDAVLLGGADEEGESDYAEDDDEFGRGEELGLVMEGA